ncbi:MAG: hypothetical protein IJT84_06100 [Clostridia bacterium]|nr:hypothetical protein [Clostridia bacterium]
MDLRYMKEFCKWIVGNKIKKVNEIQKELVKIVIDYSTTERDIVFAIELLKMFLLSNCGY